MPAIMPEQGNSQWECRGRGRYDLDFSPVSPKTGPTAFDFLK
jgi:hypothetical protein